jgi:toxin ParE1/3/4
MIVISPDAATDVERIRSFLEERNPDAAKRALATIWSALEKVQIFPGLGRPTEDPEIRQIVVQFGSAGYIVRYSADGSNIFVTRIWHGREARE